MDISPRSCRLCLSTTEFIISLYSNYCEKNNLIDKILACYKLSIKESDYLTAICYKCAGDVEKHYDSIILVKESQMRLDSLKKSRELKTEANRRHVKSYVREQVMDADYTFSFLDVSFSEEPKKSKQSSAFFSYFSSPLNVKNSNDCKWKTPRSISARNNPKRENKREESNGNHLEKSRRRSRDLFESPSQDNPENDFRNLSMDWKLSPDEDRMRRVRETCFGRSDFC